MKNADARVFCIKHELAKYKKFFYFNRESGESYAERVSQFRAILENPPSLEELSGIESSKTLRDMALAAPSLLGLMCNPPVSQPASSSSSSFEPPPPPIQVSESSPTASTFTLEKYRQLELEQKERRRKIRAALTKQKSKNTMETENKVEKEEETPQRQVITNRLQALRDELELRLNEAEEDAETARKTKAERTSQPDEEQEKEKVVSEERNTDDKGEPKDRQSKKVNKTNLLSFFA